MPVIKSAKKKLKQDRKKTLQNKLIKNTYKELIKAATKTKAKKAIDKAVSATDKAAKHHIIHKNKAGRVKSQLAKLMLSKSSHKSQSS